MITDGLPGVEFHQEQQNLEDAFIDMLGRIESGEVVPLHAVPAVPGQPAEPLRPLVDDPARWGG